MKAVKASKRLIMSIVAFLASVILCVGAVLAWFVMNDKANADSASVGAGNGDIVRFEVTVYYLDNATGGYVTVEDKGGNVKDAFGETYDVDDGNDGYLTSNKDSMRPYGGFGNNFATAVLYKINYEIRVNPSFTYRIYASCPKESKLAVEKIDSEGKNFSSALSNVVAYYDAQKSGTLYSKTSNRASSFVQSNNDKDFVLQLQRGIVPDKETNENGNFEGTSYFIMDYLPDNFIYISSLMISQGGSLNSGLQLFGDLTISMESYDPNNDTDPDPTDPDEPDEPTSKSWTITVENGVGVVGEGASVAYLSKDGDSKSANSDNFKMDGNDATVTVTLSDLKAGQKILFSITGSSGSTGNSSSLKISDATNATGASSNPDSFTVPYGSESSGTYEFTVNANGMVTITIKRAEARTATITKIEISVE